MTRQIIFVVFVAMSAAEGALTTYRFNNAHHYVPRSRYGINNGVSYLEIQQTVGIPMPPVFDRAKPACKF
jgi:hypothetical protein